MQKSLKAVLFLLSLCFFTHSYCQNIDTTVIIEKNDTITTLSNEATLMIDSLLDYAKTFIGTPYKYGGKTPSGFDCSGFSSFVYAHFGYKKLSPSSPGQAQQFPKINMNHLRKGDLVFYGGRKNYKSVGHVGIICEIRSKDDFDFIHASVIKGVCIDNSKAAYYAKRFIKIARVVDK